jgi:hypothetical protein
MSRRPWLEVGQPDADHHELGDQRDQVGEHQVTSGEPPPHRPETLQDKLTEAAVGDPPTRMHISWQMIAIANVTTMNGRNKPMP